MALKESTVVRLEREITGISPDESVRHDSPAQKSYHTISQNALHAQSNNDLAGSHDGPIAPHVDRGPHSSRWGQSHPVLQGSEFGVFNGLPTRNEPDISDVAGNEFFNQDVENMANNYDINDPWLSWNNSTAEPQSIDQAFYKIGGFDGGPFYHNTTVFPGFDDHIYMDSVLNFQAAYSGS